MSLFAVVDVETTGGSLEQGSRITEIAVVVHDGNSIHETFSSLVNPGVSIPPFISNLTGITDEMVATAPSFTELTEKLLTLLANKIFVAHNAAFDLSHVCSEFSRCGIDFSAEKLCTCQLSRHVFKGFGSYSLQALTKNLSIELNGHHRALNDAMAASEILKLLIHKQGLQNIIMHRSLQEKENFRASELTDKLPESAGIYFFIDSNNEIFYIGKSKNIKKRVIGHLSKSKTGKSKKMRLMLHDISYYLAGCEMLACMLEIDEIRKYKPFFNRVGKEDKNFCLTATKKEGLPCYSISDTETCNTTILKLFKTRKSAEEYVSFITERFNLCRCLNGLDKYSERCFYTQIKKCNGVIQKRENESEYLNRYNESLLTFNNPCNDVAIFLDNDLLPEEYVAFVCYNNRIGYTFVKKNNIPVGDNLIKQSSFFNSNAEASVLFNSYLKRKKYKLMLPIESKV